MYHHLERKRNEAGLKWRNLQRGWLENPRVAYWSYVYTENAGGSSPSPPTTLFRHFWRCTREVRVVPMYHRMLPIERIRRVLLVRWAVPGVVLFRDPHRCAEPLRNLVHRYIRVGHPDAGRMPKHMR